MTYEQWLKEVDRELDAVCGVDSGDLADCPYRDWYEDGLAPKDVVRDVLERNGYPEELLADIP